jgi:hypothetical protein
MKVRDRLIVAVVGAIVVVAAVWLLLVAPERSKVSNLDTQINTARASLASAQATLASDRATAAGYPNDVAAISQVMTAVPPDPQEPNIVTTITKLAGTSVDVHEISVGGASSTPTGETGIGLTFTFHATYGALEGFVARLDNLLKTDGSEINASGRAFTVNSISLTPLTATEATATVTVVAYSQNASAPVASTATPTGSTGATGTTPTTTP